MHACHGCQFAMDSREDESHLLALLAVAYVECNKNRRKKRRQWCKEWMQRRNMPKYISIKSLGTSFFRWDIVLIKNIGTLL